MPDPPCVTTPPSPLTVAVRAAGRGAVAAARLAVDVLRSRPVTGALWAARLALIVVGVLALAAAAAVVFAAWLALAVFVGLVAAGLIAFGVLANVIGSTGPHY